MCDMSRRDTSNFYFVLGYFKYYVISNKVYEAGVDNTTDDGSQNSNESSGLDISSSEIIIGIISIIIVGIITFIVTKYQSVKVSDTDNNENAMDKKAQMELSSMLVLDSSGSAEIKTSSIQL